MPLFIWHVRKCHADLAQLVPWLSVARTHYTQNPWGQVTVAGGSAGTLFNHMAQVTRLSLSLWEDAPAGPLPHGGRKIDIQTHDYKLSLVSFHFLLMPVKPPR